MTPKEIVQRTLDFAGPERLARSFPEPWGGDFFHVGPDTRDLETDWMPVGGGRSEMRDAWGNTWARIDDISKGEVVKGALEHIEQVAELPMPPLGDPKRFESAARSIAQDPAARGRFIVGSLPGFTFNIARKIRRLDIYMMDLHLHREHIETLHDRVDEVLVAMMDNYGRIGADAIMFPEDWGTQLGLMIRPVMWREIFRPRFEKLCAAARRNGLKVLMHSCGRMTDIIPDLIEVGIDALQFDQQEVHGLDTLAKFTGRITFWCPVDIQAVLRKGNEADIRAWARFLVERLWCGGRGGFIAGFYSDEKSIGVNPEWQAWACDEFVKAGRR